MDMVQVVLLIIVVLLLAAKSDLRHILRPHKLLLVDSCGLIDGRIVPIAQAGFITEQLVIPRFIMSELQLLADGQNAHKRERARHGLDVIHELQNVSGLKLKIDLTATEGASTTDEKLIQLAKRLQARIYTTDYNLAKVATVEGLEVTNVNALAQALRPIALPGEMIEVTVTQKGQARDQGVGYLEDGTMIVIEGAARLIGEQATITVDRMQQTVAGKMMFGHLQRQPRTSKEVMSKPSKTRRVRSKDEILRQRLRH